MATITEILNNILHARYGREVRQSIHDGIKKCYDDGKTNFGGVLVKEGTYTTSDTAWTEGTTDCRLRLEPGYYILTCRMAHDKDTRAERQEYRQFQVKNTGGSVDFFGFGNSRTWFYQQSDASGCIAPSCVTASFTIRVNSTTTIYPYVHTSRGGMQFLCGFSAAKIGNI